jgi:predicted helicase
LIERGKECLPSSLTILDNATFRGMRQSLLNTFTNIYILNLHGNVKKKEVAPDGSEDENIFDIQQGVAIGLFIKEPDKTSPAKIHYAYMWDTRYSKYHALFETGTNTTKWVELTPNTPFYFFVPREEELRPGYEKGWKVTEIFPLNRSGIITARDESVIDFEPDPIKKRIDVFLDKGFSDIEIKKRLSLSENYMWRVSRARRQLMSVKDWESFFNKILYRPFDIRPIYYHASVVWRTSQEVMHHILAGENLVLVMSGQTKDPFGPFVTNKLVAHKAVARYDVNYAFPIYLYPAEGEM